MSKRVVIIGAGIIGLCSAYYAAKRGHQVTVIDRDSENRDGCSFGNAGMIVPSHFVPLAAPGMVALGLKWMWNPESPFYIKPRLDAGLLDWGFKFWQAATAAHVDRSAPLLRDLNLASRACYEELAALPSVDFGLTRKGLLMLCKTEQTLEEEAHQAAHANKLGVPAEVLDAKQTAERDTGVTMDVTGSVYYPKDCHLSPNRLMASLKQQCDVLGVKFRWNEEVLRISRQDSRITHLHLANGELKADEFVLCGGSWSGELAQQLSLNLPMQAGKGYSLTLSKPRQLPGLCSILTEARIAVTPMGDTLRFGGTMEIAGLNQDINPTRVRGIIKSAPKYFPEFGENDFTGIKPWCGLRPCSPDGLPYLGRTGNNSNLTIATGHAMMGLSLGPITGRLVTEILTNEHTSHDLALLSPDRYA